MYLPRSSEPNFHPEFGLVCPSSTFRRIARAVIVSIVIGAAVGAVLVFALVPRDLAGGEKALNIIFADQAAAAGAPATTDGAKPLPSAEPEPVEGKTARSLSADPAAPEEPKASAKKKRKKVAQRSRRRERDLAEEREDDASTASYGIRGAQARRDDVRNW